MEISIWGLQKCPLFPKIHLYFRIRTSENLCTLKRRFHELISSRMRVKHNSRYKKREAKRFFGRFFARIALYSIHPRVLRSFAADQEKNREIVAETKKESPGKTVTD